MSSTPHAPRLATLRTVTAYVVWSLCCLAALTLSGAALLVALKVDPASAWGWWLQAADALAWGWFERHPHQAVGGVDARDAAVRWGSGAAGLLLLGAVTQWIVRPRSTVR